MSGEVFVTQEKGWTKCGPDKQEEKVKKKYCLAFLGFLSRDSA